MEAYEKIRKAVGIAINVRDKVVLTWEERDALALLCNIAEEVIKL